MIENLFHESDEKLKEDYIELRKLLLYCMMIDMRIDLIKHLYTLNL